MPGIYIIHMKSLSDVIDLFDYALILVLPSLFSFIVFVQYNFDPHFIFMLDGSFLKNVS